MNDKIKLLPESVSNQIAAGEVVNRPSSVIKEMVENSLDANATEITINYRNGGHDLIHIVDNGVGMSPNDARMAFEKHATSKIDEAEDIYSLHTFGFRGEALASIAAVAQVELRSRTEDASIGTQTTIHGSQFVDQQPIACPVGSQFYVRNLFFNTPARRKFLDRATTCSNQIKSEFKRLAICHPTKSFELYADDALIYHLSPATPAERIVDVIGRQIKKNLLEVKTDTKIVKIGGYIGRPEAAKKGTLEQYLYVNGRYFKSPYINRAITRAYEKIIPAGLNPSYFIFLEVSPDEVDVNIHPQKTEVKFVDESGVWQILNASVRETLARTNSLPMIEFDNVSEIEIPIHNKGVRYDEPRTTTNREYNPFDSSYGESSTPKSWMMIPSTQSQRGVLAHSQPSDEWNISSESSYIDIEESSYQGDNEVWQTLQFDNENENENEPSQQRTPTIDIRSLMLMNERYAWCKLNSNNISVIDLKRAKEQILFSHYMNTLTRGESVSQTILFPIELELSTEEFSIMEDNMVEFAALGFNISTSSPEGHNRISVTGLPADVTTESADRVIYELLHIVSTPEDVAEGRRRNLASTLAYNISHDTSHTITEAEAEQIVAQLLQIGELGHTPRGKAIMWEVTTKEIKQRLG